jgi:hypothetical protein
MRKALNVTLITLGAIFFVGVIFLWLAAIDGSTGTSLTGTTKTVKGTVISVACDEPTKDINFGIEGVERSFYINRALQQGFVCDELTKKLLSKQVEISYVDSWISPWEGTHINRLTCNGEVIYTELQ